MRGLLSISCSLNKDGKDVASGTGRLVTGLVEDAELFEKFKVCIQSNMAGEGEAVGYVTTHAIAYSPLPCSPFSLKWKELKNPVIRKILREMLSCV